MNELTSIEQIKFTNDVCECYSRKKKMKIRREIILEKCDKCGHEYTPRKIKNWLQCPKCHKLSTV